MLTTLTNESFIVHFGLRYNPIAGSSILFDRIANRVAVRCEATNICACREQAPDAFGACLPLKYMSCPTSPASLAA